MTTEFLEKENEDHKVNKTAFNKAIEFMRHLQNLEMLCDQSLINAEYDIAHKVLQAWFEKLSSKIEKGFPKEYKDILLQLENIGPLIYIDDIPGEMKEKVLRGVKRKLEMIMDELNLQMPDQGGEDDEPFKNLIE